MGGIKPVQFGLNLFSKVLFLSLVYLLLLKWCCALSSSCWESLVKLAIVLLWTQDRANVGDQTIFRRWNSFWKKSHSTSFLSHILDQTRTWMSCSSDGHVHVHASCGNGEFSWLQTLPKPSHSRLMGKLLKGARSTCTPHTPSASAWPWISLSSTMRSRTILPKPADWPNRYTGLSSSKISSAPVSSTL